MKKYIVIKDNKVIRVVVCSDSSKIKLAEDESIQPAVGKVTVGLPFVGSAQPVKEKRVERRNYKDMAIGAGIATGVALVAGAVKYFGGF